MFLASGGLTLSRSRLRSFFRPLQGPSCCRLCYYRRHRSLRFFGGLRETILKRDRFRCRACGDVARLVVHQEHNEKRGLITLCIGCIAIGCFGVGYRKSAQTVD